MTAGAAVVVKVTGKGKVSRKLNRIGPEAIKRVSQALYAGGQLIENDAALSITSGSVSGKFHIVSRPGEPPNNDTGVLARNIETRLVAPLKVEVTSSAPYAVPLETGTSKMAARPYMGPAAHRQRKAVVAKVKAAVNEAIRSAGNGAG